MVQREPRQQQIVDSVGPTTQAPHNPQLVVDLTEPSTPEIEIDLRLYVENDAGLLGASRLSFFIKRAVDIAGSIIALILLSPLLLVTAIAVTLTSPGPPIFRQTRVGIDGRRFSFYKFRSMSVTAEQERDRLVDLNERAGPIFKIKDDPRITKVGWLTRRSSIDELPQLWNVLRGDMSLVGPRPPLPAEVEQYSAWEGQRLLVKPGITCIWQVSGRSDLDFETWVAMDIEYIERWRLWLDFVLLVRTIPAVLSGRGAY